MKQADMKQADMKQAAKRDAIRAQVLTTLRSGGAKDPARPVVAGRQRTVTLYA